MENTTNKNHGIRLGVTIFSVAVLIVVCVALLSDPAAAGIMLARIYSLLTDKMGWTFLVFGFCCFFFLLWLAFSKYGKIRLGKPGEKPQFSRFAWIAMLFCTGQGSTLIYWSIVEPLQYYDGPPFGLKVGSTSAVEYAASYGSFHWGLIPWALLTIPTVPLAYYLFVRRKAQVSLSSTLEGHMAPSIRKPLCAAIDVLVIFATVANACTCLGIETPTIASLISQYTGLKVSLGMEICIIIVFVAIFSCSSFLGLEKGIKKLSSLNIYLVYGIFIVMLIVGPTTFIMNTFVNDVGIMLNNFFRMSLYTDPIGQSLWPQGWTMFYWAWWLCATPFTALFIAQISKGRTVREVALGGVIWGTLGDFVAFGVLGGSTIHAQVFEGVDLVTVLNEKGAPMAVATLLARFPLAGLLVPLTIISMIIFSSTTYDSGAFVLSSLTYRPKTAGEESPRWLRLMWSSIVGAASIILLLIGGLEPLQSFSLITAIPILFICVFVVIFFMKDLHHDYTLVMTKAGKGDETIAFDLTEEGELARDEVPAAEEAVPAAEG